MYITFFILIPRNRLKNHCVGGTLLYTMVFEPVSGDQYEESYGSLMMIIKLTIQNVSHFKGKNCKDKDRGAYYILGINE